MVSGLGRLLEARIFLRQDRPREAIAVLDSLIQASAPLADAYALRARAREEIEDLAGAIDDLGAALQLSERIDLYLHRGALLEQVNRFGEAEENYQDGVLATGATTLRRALIRIQRQNEHFREALREADVLVAQSRGASRFLVLRADVLQALGRHVEARRTRESALQEARQRFSERPSALALLERGRSLLALGRLQEAESDLEQALRRAPRMREAHGLLAEARGGLQ